MRARLGSLSPEQIQTVEALTRGIVNKLAHGPIAEIRRLAADPDGEEALEALRQAFRLDPDNPNRDK